MKSINNFLNESLILEANTSGQFYESLVCYLFNLDMDDFLKDRDNNTWDEHIIKWHQWMKLKIDNPWVESCITTAKAIRNFLPQEAGIKCNMSDYVAMHIDGKDFDYDINIPTSAKNIEQIFHSKDEASKELGIDCSDMYYGKQKDTWNKADILLVLKDKADSIMRYLTYYATNGESVNFILKDMINTNYIVPISLKAVKLSSDSLKLAYKNKKSIAITPSSVIIKKQDFDNEEIPVPISAYFFNAPMNKLIGSASASIYFYPKGSYNYKDTLIVIRQKMRLNEPEIYIEGKYKGRDVKNGTTESHLLGAGMTNICKYIGTFDIYKDFTSTKEMIDAYNKYGIDFNFTDEDCKLSDEAEKPIYTYASFRGFLGIIEAYCKKEGISASEFSKNLAKFWIFIYSACTRTNYKLGWYKIY